MPYQQGPGDPFITFDETEMEKRVSAFAKANAIGGQAAWDLFVNGLTAAQSVAVSQGLLRAFKFSTP
jgi:hypothetical protein